MCVVTFVAMHAQVSIGQLTREATKTSERNVFTWRNRCLRLLYDGGLRDRLIDDETGSLVYAYPRALELAKAMLKFEHAATPPEGSDTEEKQHENGDDGTAACRLDAQGVEAHRAVAGGGNAAPNRKAGDGKSSLGLSRFSLFRRYSCCRLWAYACVAVLRACVGVCLRERARG
jgi:hypothetical protein